MKTNNATETAVKAMETTREVAGDYWAKCLGQRSAYETPCGSTYELTPVQLECALMSSEWEEVSHPAVQPSCRVFKTRLAGMVGIVPLASLPADMEVTLRDPKGTGRLDACIDRAKVPGELASTSETYMIAGEDEGKFMCFTFHPGEPVPLSTLPTDGNNYGSTITVAQAIALGATFAKVEG